MMPPVKENTMKEDTDLLKSFRVDSKNPGPNLLLTAGVHGDEYEPILTALELIRTIPRILVSGSVTIVTVVNGTAYGAGSRYGDDGLDLARICPGKVDGSSSERNAFQLSTLIREAHYLIDMHTGGMAHDIYPMAGFMILPSHDLLERQRELALACNLPVIWGTDHLPDGRTLSVARDAGIPAIYLEYGGGSGIRNNVVESYKEGIINVLKLLKMTKGPVDILSPAGRFWVEDSRPDSGYFQGKMPSLGAGIFVPVVKPGILIEKGQRFGRIVNPVTKNVENILADMDGLVLSVRISVHVKKGDALGFILPITGPGKVIIN